ncbi:MAG: hypothetical protein MI923_01345 [Phycisphaerales bacterium]|nr:hypothetical protein [Phycisphaerales bacterium]
MTCAIIVTLTETLTQKEDPEVFLGRRRIALEKRAIEMKTHGQDVVRRHGAALHRSGLQQKQGRRDIGYDASSQHAAFFYSARMLSSNRSET